jgi:prepilin-type N-terminal cleavage/methylation domain-containing protein
MRRERRAFTLIELLAVIAIIAAIAAIAFPVLARVRENGRRATCISNLHQIGLALKMYRDDWDGHEARYGVRLSHSDLGLPYNQLALEDYVKDKNIFWCPSDQRDRRLWNSSYVTNYLCSEQTMPQIDWEEFAALRGPDFPVVMCYSHNGTEVPSQERYSWEQLLCIILRIDGRVTVVKYGASDPIDMNNG